MAKNILEFEKPIFELEKKIEEMKKLEDNLDIKKEGETISKKKFQEILNNLDIGYFKGVRGVCQ